jgi:hypothetical protein
VDRRRSRSRTAIGTKEAIMKGRIHRVLGAAGVVLAGVALLAGGVQASDRPDDRAGAIGVGGVAAPAPTGAFERAVERHVAEMLYDPFAGDAGPVRPDDRGGVRGPGMVATSMSANAAVGPADEFAWGDAAFGAAVMFGLLVALGAFATLTVRNRGRTLAR